MHLFKKKKSPKTVIDQLNERLHKLPAPERVQTLVTKASKKSEETKKASDDSSGTQTIKRTSTFSRLQTFKTASNAISSDLSADHGNPTVTGSECVIGLEQGLEQDEILALDFVEKRLDTLNSFLDNTEKEDDVIVLVRHALETDLVAKLLAHHPAMSFQSRQFVTNLICGIIQRALAHEELKSLLIQYMNQHKERILQRLLQNYSNPITFLYTGAIFRSCLKCESIYMKCLSGDFVVFNVFFAKFLKVESFEKVSDAFQTFRDILQGNKKIVCDFLDEHYDTFFPKYNELLNSAEYIAQRQSLKLLSDLLLAKPSKKVMLRYIGETENLVLIMNLMRVTSQSMRLEAFHVFKIFVANPNKTEGITQILFRNREKLVVYLSKLTNDKEEGLFKDEKDLIIRTLQNLSVPP